MLFIAEMFGHLRLHGTFQHGLGQLLQQTVFTNDVFWLLVVRQQLVDEFEVDSHRVSLVCFFRWPFTQFNLHPHDATGTATYHAFTAPSGGTFSYTVTNPSPGVWSFYVFTLS